MSQITGEKVQLKKLFGDEFFFSVPDYQRPYCWEIEHCEQLFDDIFESDRQNEYFLGTVILQEVEQVGTGKKYDVIDGQQRLTTLQLLLACLRDDVEKEEFKRSTQEKIYQKYNPADGIPEKVKLETREPEFFREYVQTEGGTEHVDKFLPSNDAQQKLVEAVMLFKEKLYKLSQTDIESLIQHLSQRCVMIYVSTKDFEDAYRLFTIINDRGLQLRRIDILKANNLAEINDSTVRKEYAKIWEDMEDDLGSEEFENLISFIRSIEVKEKAKEDVLKEFNKLIFGKDKIARGQEFIQYLKEYKEIYQRLVVDRDVFEKDAQHKKICIQYKNLIYIMKNFLPSNEWIPPLLYYYQKFDKEKLLDFIIKLEQKFIADWVIGLTLTKRIVNMNAVLKEIELATEPSEIINNVVLEFDHNRFKNEIGQDVYGKSYVKYILLKLEYLESEHNVERKYGTLSVEHVLPQNPKGKWTDIFDLDERTYWTNKLANLVLLSKRKNSSASNLDFEDKKDKYFKGRISDLARSQKILSYTEWTPAVLAKRQNDILSLLTN
ncbi:hypothetical protein Tfer_2114 [Thermincola ferriacetica]|uniref:DUF262 domain-containing protein n=1 Tax=Thermincola ferriacetica TaxID=281456 RepID=A0A0L6W166_9FIRM|nr:DUF262 domain-containing protein [Thermincola ferriacetica]KNZ69317.1 hypothetical protein Tfer_2114 [Thermincola ferriacetica]